MLYSNIEKFSFSMQRIKYLIYIVDKYVVQVDAIKIQAIHDLIAPLNMTELYSLLVLTNLYCRFMLGFPHIYWPLSQVTKCGDKDNLFYYES
jgi:hypothetical protein